MTRKIDADYLVVGAGAMGMAFTDALTDHADVRVAVVDRRHSVGGHWLEAYPFVRLHQSSAFYGVPSTLLGGGQLQQRGPEVGLQERASQAAICEYYARALDRMVESGRVEFYPNAEYVGDRTVVSHVSGQRYEVPEHCRIVDAHYLAPSIPAEKPPPFAVDADARVVPVNALARIEHGAASVRRRRLRQDGHRRLHLAALPGSRSRRDLLGPAEGAVDDEPSGGPAGSGDLPGHGRRHHARR